MRGHDDQVAASGLCCFDNRGGWVRIRNVQEFCGYPDLLRHSSSFIEHFARMFLAGCVKMINLFLRRNPSRGVPAAIVDGSGSVTVTTVTLAFKAFAKATPCSTPFLATSDPSVLKRILVYIRRLPCSSKRLLWRALRLDAKTADYAAFEMGPPLRLEIQSCHGAFANFGL